MFKPCCKKFEKLSIQYVDLVVTEDESLRMLAELLMRTNNVDPLTNRELHSLAHEIEQYLNRKIVREYSIFNRTLHACTFDDADLGAEIVRIHGKLKEY